VAQNFVVSGYVRPGGEGKTLPLQRRILASIRDPQSTMSLAVGLFAACTALPSGGLAPTLRDIGPSTIGSYIRDAGPGYRAVRFVPAPDTHLIRVSDETLLEILGASGLEHPLELRPWHICQRTSQAEVQTYDEIYNYARTGRARWEVHPPRLAYVDGARYCGHLPQFPFNHAAGVASKGGPEFFSGSPLVSAIRIPRV